jgi:2-keto-4-pentenoate hydratase
MKKEALARAVAWLAEAWQQGVPLKELPKGYCPRTTAEGMQLQDALAKHLDFAVGGWKIGCSSKYAQKLLKTRGPFAGRVFAARIYDSGAVLPGSAYHLRGLEGEFAFVLARDLKPRKRAYSRAEVAAAVGALRPAIEVVDSRFADWLQVDTACLIADMGCNGALVLGPPVPRWRSLDLRQAPARMTVNGKTVGEGTGAAALGDPLLSLTWLANYLRRRTGLKAGQVITTGTCTGFHRAGPADDVTADFGSLGQVSIRFVT